MNNSPTILLSAHSIKETLKHYLQLSIAERQQAQQPNIAKICLSTNFPSLKTRASLMRMTMILKSLMAQNKILNQYQNHKNK